MIRKIIRRKFRIRTKTLFVNNDILQSLFNFISLLNNDIIYLIEGYILYSIRIPLLMECLWKKYSFYILCIAGIFSKHFSKLNGDIILCLILQYRAIILSMFLIIFYPWIYKKIFKISYIVISKFVKQPTLSNNKSDWGSYLHLFGICLFWLMILHFNIYLLFISNFSFIFNILSLIILSLIFNIENYYIYLFINFIAEKLSDTYYNLKSDPCNFISSRFTNLLGMRYGYLIMILSYSFSWYESIFCYLTSDFLYKFIVNFKWLGIVSIRSPLSLILQGPDFRRDITNILSNQTTGLSKNHIESLNFSPNELEYLAIIAGISRFEVGREGPYFAISANLDNPGLKSRLVPYEKLLFSQPKEGSNPTTGLFIEAGSGIGRRSDNIIRSETSTAAYIGPSRTAKDGVMYKQKMYKFIDYLYHPIIRENLLFITTNQGDDYIPYDPVNRKHAGKYLYLYNPESDRFHFLNMKSPERVRTSINYLPVNKLHLIKYKHTDSEILRKLAIENRNAFAMFRPVITQARR